MNRLTPSHWLRQVLERWLDVRDQHALGDLEEEFRERVLRDAPRISAELWYVREALSLLLAVTLGRISGKRDTETLTSDTMGEGMMNGMGRDLVHALRGLLRDPGTTVVIALTLAVSVGATTAIFSVANAAFLTPLPYPGADRLVRVYTGSKADPEVALAVSPLDWRDFATFEGVVEASGVWSLGESVHMIDAEQPLRLVAPRASAGLFRILGAEPVAGRFFTVDEEVPGQDDVVVLSHGLWERAFGADPAVVGRPVVLDGRSHRVVGVAPRAAY